MTGKMLGFLLCAILVPLVVNELGDLVPSLAKFLLRWGARRIGRTGQAERYEEEWLADLERVPGKLTKLVHACRVLVWSVPRLRAQFRQPARRARLPGVLVDLMMNRISKDLAESREIDATLQNVAEELVPQFADHCFIDLFQGDALNRRVQRHIGDSTPPQGWAQTGEQILYPEGHFCQQAMMRLETVLVTNLMCEDIPAPSAQSAAASREAELTSILTAPLYARGTLLGIMSVAMSKSTNRAKKCYTATDRDLIAAIAKRVSTAIDNATLGAAGHHTAPAPPNSRSQCPSALLPRTWIIKALPYARLLTPE